MLSLALPRVKGALFYAVVGLAAAFWALTGPGRNLEYEYTLLVAYTLLIGLPLSALLPFSAHGDHPWPYVVGISVILLAAPPAILYATGLCPCNEREFWWWWSAQELPAFFWGATLYGLGRRLRHHGLSWRRLLLAGFVLILAVVTHVVCIMWFFPQKRLVHPIAGFLHGPIYDTWIPIDRGILWARAGHLALAAAFFAWAWLPKKPARLIAVATLASLALWGALAASPYPSLGSGKEVLEHFLDQSLAGRGFTMHYHREATDKATPINVARLFRDAQFHHDELAGLFGAAAATHVDIYVYPDNNRKKLWFGGGSTDVTDVYSPSVHINGQSWPHPTLRHELVHALASGFGYHGLGFHPNMAFTEGLAVALAPEDDDMSLDEGAAAILSSHKIGDVTALFSPLFWQESGARAYTIAGSFINFVRTTYGFDAVRRLYAGSSWQDVFQKGRDEIIQDWRTHILSVAHGDAQAMTAEALYRYPGVWRDLCPHSKATLARPPVDDSLLRFLRWPAGWQGGSDYDAWRRALTPDDRNLLISQLMHQSRLDLKETPPRLTAIEAGLKTYGHWPPVTVEDVELRLLASDVAAVKGNAADASALVASILQVAGTKSVGDDLFRQAFARRYLYGEMSWENARAWQLFLAGVGPMPSEPGTWMTRYLRFRNHPEIRPKRLSTLATDTDEGLWHDLLTETIPDSIPTAFRLEWFKAIATQAMREQAYEDAAQAYEQAAAAAPSGSRDLMREHKRRAIFYAQAGRFAPE